MPLFVDENGTWLGRMNSGPDGSTEVNKAPSSMKQTWNFEADSWDGITRDWDDVREDRECCITEAVDTLNQHTNETTYNLPKKLTDEKAQEWADYLQLLKEVTDTTLNPTHTPSNVYNGSDKWPTKPE